MCTQNSTRSNIRWAWRSRLRITKSCYPHLALKPFPRLCSLEGHALGWDRRYIYISTSNAILGEIKVDGKHRGLFGWNPPTEASKKELLPNSLWRTRFTQFRSAREENPQLLVMCALLRLRLYSSLPRASGILSWDLLTTNILALNLPHRKYPVSVPEPEPCLTYLAKKYYSSTRPEAWSIFLWSCLLSHLWSRG